MRSALSPTGWTAVSLSAALLACAPPAADAADGTAGAPSGGMQQNNPSAGNSGNAAGSNAAGSENNGGNPSSAGNSGSAGSSSGGSADAPSAEPEAAQPSMGCGKVPEIAPGEFASSMIMGRNTWVRLPTDYSPERAYPVIFMWKGCSAAGVQAYGMQNVAGSDAIIAQGDFPPGADCYDTGDGAQFVDLPLFDALLEQLEANYCVDKAHLFSAGFSSGAWLTQLLACQRGDVLRGIGTIAGAFKPTFLMGQPSCKGDGLSAFMVSDLDDHNNPFYDEDKDGDSVEIAVNHWLVQNGCSETAWSMQAGTPTTPDQDVCRAFTDCGSNPVKLCLTSGKGHAAQEQLSMPGFWELFQQSLPK